MHLAYIWIVCHLSAKNYQNRWKFDEVLTKKNLLSFFWGQGVDFSVVFFLLHISINTTPAVNDADTLAET